jgi:hypothetical protein
MSNIQVTYSTSANNARSESNIAINPYNPNQIIGASKKFIDPFAYRFTLAPVYSNDAGHTWTESPALALLAGWDGISDPALAWDNIGNCFLVALPFAPGTAVLGIAVYKSTDGGVTWSAPNVIHTSAGDDKQWAIGDPNSGSVYAAWDDGNTLRFARTTDHGVTWKGTTASPGPGAALSTSSFAPEMAVNSSGHLYIFMLAGSAITFVKSVDGGNTFTVPQTAVTGLTTIGSVLPTTNGWAHFPGGKFRVLTLATCCVGRNDEIMVAWSDGRETDGMGNHPSRIYYRRSVDGGVTWLGSVSGDPLLANNSSISKALYHFHPQIINRPNSDQVACSFYEFGPKTGGTNLIDTMIAYSLNNGGSFGNATVVTDTPWDPLLDAPWAHGDPQVQFIGDYFGLDASHVGFYPLWTDTRTLIQELFTDIANPPVRKSIKEYTDKVKEHKEFKEFVPDKIWVKEHLPEYGKDLLPEKPLIKDKDKEKDVFENLGDKFATEAVGPLARGIDERFRQLETKIEALDRTLQKADIFIAPSKRPDVAAKVIRKSNAQARRKPPAK